MSNCTRHGGWTDWSPWSACSAPCGPGYQHRTRSCTNPRPLFGGRNCIGQSQEERGCPVNPACHPQSGQIQRVAAAINAITHWGEWGAWSSCSSNCGGGYQFRQRECTLSNIRDCELGCSKEYRNCNIQECSEVRSIAEWTPWLVSNQTGGQKGYYEQRFRYQCIGKVPHSSLLRVVTKKDERFCRDVSDCHDSRYAVTSQNASWSEWSPWSECPVTCGGGIQRRERLCIGSSDNDVQGCAGQSIEERQCAIHSCPTEGWSEWTDWSECDNRGEQHRKRHCIAKNDYRRTCLGGVHTRESRICLHEGVSLAVSSVKCSGATPLAVTVASIIAYMLGLATMILAVRIYNQRSHEDAMMNSASLSTSLQQIPVPKRLGSLPLVPVENNTYVPTLAFKGPGQFSTLQHHPSTPIKAATIKRSNTFRAQISDDHNF